MVLDLQVLEVLSSKAPQSSDPYQDLVEASALEGLDPSELRRQAGKVLRALNSLSFGWGLTACFEQGVENLPGDHSLEEYVAWIGEEEGFRPDLIGYAVIEVEQVLLQAGNISLEECLEQWLKEAIAQ